MSDTQATREVTRARTDASVRATRQRVWSRFLWIALALHVPLYFYPILRLCDWLGAPWWLTAAIFFPLGGSQIVSRMYLRGKRGLAARAYRKVADLWLGLSPLTLLTLLVFEIVVATTSVSTQVAGSWVIGIVALAGVGGVVNALMPVVRRISLVSDKLAAPVRFVQITDVHIGSRSPDFLSRVVDRINRLAPDFVCITGDFVDAPGISLDDLRSLESIDCPIYFTIGNHERYEDLDDILARLSQLGVVVLRDAATHYRDDLQVIGIDDLEDEMQVERQLRKIDVDQGAFALLLYHRPRGLEAASAAGIDLMLSGHTHNGQIVPFNLVVGRVFDRIAGMHEHDGTRLYVSEGTGTWGPVMRIGTRSEITLFEMTPAPD